jgi:hypothetical protein
MFAAILCCCLAVAFAGAAVWQHNQHSSSLDDAAKHDSTAALFQDAEAEGSQAGSLLQQYVQTGDETLLKQINDHTSAGVTKLTAAVQQSGINAQPFLDGGTALVQAEGQIIALRQGGDVQTAAAGLQQLSTQFQAFTQKQNDVVTAEQASAASARSDADSASTAQTWLIIGTAIAALAALGSGAVFVLRSASRRPTLDATTTA